MKLKFTGQGRGEIDDDKKRSVRDLTVVLKISCTHMNNLLLILLS